MTLRREPFHARLLADVLRLAYLGVIGLSVAAALVLLPRVYPLWRDVAGRLVAVLATQILAVALLRQVTPKPLDGLHRVGANSAYLRWLMSSVLSEVAQRGLVRAPFWFLHGTRCLYLRALGADLAWRVSIPIDVVIREPSLVAIGSGAQLESGVKLESTSFGEGRIQVGTISLGEGCLIGAHAVVLGGASIAHDARVGAGALIAQDARIGFAASIAARAVIGERAEVGSYAVIGAGAVIGEGAHVGERARVLPGSTVPPGRKIAEREVWPRDEEMRTGEPGRARPTSVVVAPELTSTES